MTVEINGKLFTEYRFKEPQRPFFYPVIGPTGEPVMRHWPVENSDPNDARDHVHQKSLWFTHGAVNGIDFWSDGKGTIVHDKFLEVSSGPQSGVITSQNKWVAPDGKIILTDTRTHRFYNDPDGTIMDWEITLHASNGQVTFGDTKEGSMAIRLAPTMQLGGKVGKGHIINSEGVTDNATWSKRRRLVSTTTGRSRARSSASRSSTIPTTRGTRRGGMSATTACSPPIRSASTISRRNPPARAIW